MIAIIGLLASVVLASINSARDKGANAAAKSSLNNARAQAELFYDDNARSYDDGTDAVCTTGTNNLSTLLTAADNAVTAADVCFDTAAGWAASIDLNAPAGFYCVDSTGFGGELLVDPALSAADVVCN